LTRTDSENADEPDCYDHTDRNENAGHVKRSKLHFQKLKLFHQKALQPAIIRMHSHLP